MNKKEKIINIFSLRKINSIILILILFILIRHAIITSLCMAGLIKYSPNLKETGRELFLCLLLHIIISFYLFIKDKIKQKNIKTYSFIRKDTDIQIYSGIVIIVFIILHIIIYQASVMNLPLSIKIMHIIIDTLLFISINIHLQVSIPRLLISFGFLKADQSYQKINMLIKIALFIILVGLISSELIFHIL